MKGHVKKSQSLSRGRMGGIRASNHDVAEQNKSFKAGSLSLQMELAEAGGDPSEYGFNQNLFVEPGKDLKLPNIQQMQEAKKTKGNAGSIMRNRNLSQTNWNIKFYDAQNQMSMVKGGKLTVDSRSKKVIPMKAEGVTVQNGQVIESNVTRWDAPSPLVFTQSVSVQKLLKTEHETDSSQPATTKHSQPPSRKIS